MNHPAWLLLCLSLPHLILCEGDWDSVSCYACGLAAVDPEADKEGSYSVDPGVKKKMYNHSCDLMDNGLSGVYEYGGQELKPRDWKEEVKLSELKKDVNGTVMQSCTEPVLDNNGTIIEQPKCTDLMRNWTELRDLPPKAYDMSMWVRKCPKGVRSCFKARGNWDDQKPIFRGCSESLYSHPTSCKRELQSVIVHPSKPPVDVEVYLCYCSQDKCNIDINKGTSLHPVGFGWMVSNCLLFIAITIYIID